MAFKIDFKSIKYHLGLRNPAACGKTKNLCLPEILKMGLSDRRNGVLPLLTKAYKIILNQSKPALIIVYRGRNTSKR